MRNLLLRAESGAAIGMGHRMRCLALAQAWRDCGGLARFALPHSSPGSPEDARQLAARARAIDADWVVVDGYVFGPEYQRALQAAGCKVLLLDDCGHGGRYSAHLILNQNLHAVESLYGDRAAYTRLLLGSQYTLLRREFRRLASRCRAISPGRRILVTLGGSDPDNVTAQILESIRSSGLANAELIVVAGPANPWRDRIAAAATKLPFPARVETRADMPALMAWADVAISAGGSTCWELAFMGVPFLVLPIADNQRPIAASLCARGVALPWSWNHGPERLSGLLEDTALRAGMARRGRELVDGQGAVRVAGLLIDLEELAA